MHTRGIVVIATVVGLTTTLTTGCTKHDPDINGRLAIAHEGGRTLVLVHTCRGDVEDIEVSADRQGLKGDQKNPVLGALHARHPVSGDVTIDLRSPGPDWEVRTPVTLPSDPGKGIIVTGRHGSSSELQQSDAYVRQIAALRPGQVVLGGESDTLGGRVVSVDQFRSQACR